jgi:hypothetical protein
MRMETSSARRGRAGKLSVWRFLRAGRRGPHGGDTLPASTQPVSTRPVSPGIGSLDGVRTVLWQCYRHLFPAHSRAAQLPNGSIVISWSLLDDPHASHPYAAPVLLWLDEGLVDLLAGSDLNQRHRIAQAHEPTLREGLRGYDPFARIPNARVVVLG